MAKNNLFFLSGPNGSGKTTLSKYICEEDSQIHAPELYSRCLKFTELDAEYRHFLKIGQRAIESFEYSKIAEEYPEKIILGNRCIYDPVAYTNVYFKKGWISRKDYENSLAFIPDFFGEDLSAPYAIILNPGYDVCKRHLEKRWTEKPKKWNENDLSYLELACDAHKAFSGFENVLYLDKEQDLSKNGLSGIVSWIHDKYNSGVSKEKAILPDANAAEGYVAGRVVHRNDDVWSEILAGAPRILDSLLEEETRNRILHSFHCTGLVDPSDKEHAIQRVIKYYCDSPEPPYSLRVDATDIVDRAFGYYACIAERYDPYASELSAQNEVSKK